MTKAAPGPSSAFARRYADKSVLVTGHTGFKGAWLSEWLLLLGATVTGYSIDCEKRSLFHELHLTERMRDIRGDVRHLADITKVIQEVQPNFIFHLAAQPLVRLSYSDPVGTFTTNVNGAINVMEAVRVSKTSCAMVMVTTDKCYENREIDYAYCETDPLGGHDPYSASKAAAEIAIASYRKSFFAAETTSGSGVALASARAGNVIGGGDWAADRIVPDAIRALKAGENIGVRNKEATRPWQHVLDPLSGYLTLGAALNKSLPSEKCPRAAKEICSSFNFGPNPESNRNVASVVDELLKHWPGQWVDRSDHQAPHEAGLLNLNINKARQVLAWQPVWNFEDAVAHTVSWYRKTSEGSDPVTLTRQQIADYQADAVRLGVEWARS
jgi:CDP-glucose 4,6-dehydratase